MRRSNKQSGVVILLLIFSFSFHSSALAQFAFNIPNRSNDRIEAYSILQVAVGGKLALCSASDKGAINLSVTGGVAPYTYKWNTNETSQNRDNLNAGTYTVRVSDTEGTTVTQSIVIQPPFPLILNSVEKKDSSCGSANNGYAKISVKVGRNGYEQDSPEYQVTWSNGLKNVWEANDLTPGTYTVVVTDRYSCDASISFDIKAAAPDIKAAAPGIVVTESLQGPGCESPTSGKISLAVTGGVAPYTYAWNTGAKTKDLTDLPAGRYEVLIHDSKGCSFQASYTLYASKSTEVTEKVIQPSCENSRGGEISLQTTGAKEPLSYLWSTGQTSSKIGGLSAGIYSVKISDASGCTVEKQYSLMATSELSLKVLESRPVSCSGESNGGISLQVSGEKGTYSISWSDGGKTLLQRKDLKGGVYTITATDESGCSATLAVSVEEKAKMQAKIETALDVDCASGKATGVAWVSIQGGNAPYTVQWNNISANAREFNFNSAGILKAIVTDAMGCVIATEAKVDFPNQTTDGARLNFNYRKLKISNDPEVSVREEVLFKSEIAPEFIAWEWEFGDGTKSTDKDPVHVFSNVGEFEVRLTGYDHFGCSAVETNIVKVTDPGEFVVIPNAFSPNGDGLNDTFIPKLRAILSFQMEIFNTWGEMLFSTDTTEGGGWDGTYNGQLVTAGNFVYRLNYVTPEGQSVNLTGGLTLIR